MFQIYNTETRKLERFETYTKQVRLYTCGPTVYNYVHLGNLRTFLFEDLLRRWLEYLNYDVVHVKNITDIDDKTIKGSHDESMSLRDFTQKYTDIFLNDLKKLKIKTAHHLPRATDYIPQIITIISSLLEKGVAYQVKSGVYFRANLASQFNQLINLEEIFLQAGASGRVNPEESDKENPEDFALWKAWSPSDGNVGWDSPFGYGRPGWHIECSAMSIHNLNKTPWEPIDIHTGGIDLTFPHHQCEIMQSESYLQNRFVRYWMHASHLMVDGKKMSKSLGNFYSLHDVINKGFHPMAIRYLLLSANYRQTLNFTWESLGAASNAVKMWHDFYLRLKPYATGSENDAYLISYINEWESALNEDLNVSHALSVLYNMMSSINSLIDNNKLTPSIASSAVNFINQANQIYEFLAPDVHQLTEKVAALLEARKLARSMKDWKLSDQLRKDLLEAGIIVEDVPEGQRWKPAKIILS